MSFFYIDYLAVLVNHIDLEHNTFIQPWNKTLRSARGSGTLQAIQSWVLARNRLILTNVLPHE